MTPMARGKLRIFMGYAAGVGKTYHMLEVAQELRANGVDVVVGYFESHGRRDTIARMAGLELVPRMKVEYRGSWFEEMDLQAILERRPVVAVVDEFPHTNVPGCEHAKRWEDVETLLESGIDVLTTMNIQHLESLNDQVQQITGVRVRETIPDWVVKQADEVVMIDVTPRALLNRLERGVIYGREKAGRALENFFRESTLVALRELALRQTAHEVGHRNVEVEADQRLLVLIDDRPETAMVIRRARRVADFIGAECFAVAVSGSGSVERELERHLNFARNLHIETRVLEGGDVARLVVDFAHRNRVTQIFLSRPSDGWRIPWLNKDLVNEIVGLAKDIEIVIVSGRQRDA